jgi:transposase-like protein
MRYTPYIGPCSVRVEHRSNARKYHPCPRCGKKGRRVRVVERTITHIALGQKVLIEARIGVYRSRCDCCQYFQAEIAGVLPKGLYSLEIRNVVANSLIRDRLPTRKVQTRMLEDYQIKLSLGFIYNCFTWAFEQINTQERRRWCLENFSKVLCIDEVHEGKRVILFATDPLSDFTVHFAINEVNDQDHMNAFLEEIRSLGFYPEVVITDGSPLYKDALMEIWKGVEHQLCLFHVFKEVNALVLDAFRQIRNRIKRQGNKGRKHKRGKPSKAAKQQRKLRAAMSKKEQAAFLWDHQYLIVRKSETLTEEDWEILDQMYQIAPEIRTLRDFTQGFYRIFERGLTPAQAAARRRHFVNRKDFQTNPILLKAIRKIRKERFHKMIGFLRRGDNAQRTSNHVERNNRTFRMLQKTRYKRRTDYTIRMAIELDLYERMLQHPLFKPSNVVKLSDYRKFPDDRVSLAACVNDG